jgi:hypothetical protein
MPDPSSSHGGEIKEEKTPCLAAHHNLVKGPATKHPYPDADLPYSPSRWCLGCLMKQWKNSTRHERTLKSKLQPSFLSKAMALVLVVIFPYSTIQIVQLKFWRVVLNHSLYQ